jgi:hypothetical protein
MVERLHAEMARRTVEIADAIAKREPAKETVKETQKAKAANS